MTVDEFNKRMKALNDEYYPEDREAFHSYADQLMFSFILINYPAAQEGIDLYRKNEKWYA